MHKVKVRADEPETTLIITFQTREPFLEVRPYTQQHAADRPEKVQMKSGTYKEVRQMEDEYFSKVHEDTTNHS